ncbi:hypothetical protein OG948_59875 (plasmid) [Embleya sp. NBC_00888]|uniref:hypothetical protein n=1 Tax=Embleya sp. NBC_00888 TaxID=2975960 RepID=UPI002F906A3C|nr:hypothetical protein OG948_59875 [Embleya sp. NBC_00888]
MPTTRHEELRTAVTGARRALAAHPDAETAPALADLIAAAEPFANFAPAVLPPVPRAGHTHEHHRHRTTDEAGAPTSTGVVIEDSADGPSCGRFPPATTDGQPTLTKVANGR